jgi:hypothetical protein
MSENETSRAQPGSFRGALLCVAGLASACGSEPLAAPTPTPHSYPIPGCERLDVAPCNTLDQECVASRLELAACLRGTEAGEPPAPRISRGKRTA